MAGPVGRARSLFWNDAERRPRTPWRLLLGGLLTAGTLVAAGLFVTVVAGLVEFRGPVLTPLSSLAGSLSVYAAGTLGLLGSGWLVDRRGWAAFGLTLDRDWWADLGFGLLLGAVLPGVVLLVELLVGVATVTDTLATHDSALLATTPETPFAVALLATLPLFVAVGVAEELLFRGYLLRNLAEGARPLGTRGALAAASTVTALLFGLAHGSNANVTALAVVNIALYGGLFAAMVLWTDRLGMPVGFHVAWNAAVSVGFGFPVSGARAPASLLVVEVSGPPYVSGGAFGPEGGLVAHVALGVGLALVTRWVVARTGGLGVRESVAVPRLRWRDRAGDASGPNRDR